VTYLVACLKKRQSMPILRVLLSQNFIFCDADFGSAIGLDLQQKLKPFLHLLNKQEMAMRSFLGNYSSSV